ncbi:hypothetical protein JMN32_18100 [Fulvivirga sp. 29W222]|uniref:Uncharacterized protein n=1 Tax=Fulvivirga marina TaxID=2494733 RepID=A0A937KD51_9BACT|nr:hypothetical protein [Fulvivirga marina]MBL6448232.1 hypothetical protein [Fulvivirga marina]
MPGTDDNVKATKKTADPQHNTRTRKHPANGRVLGINTASLTSKVKNMQLGEKIPGLIDNIKNSSLLNHKPEVPQEEQEHLKNEFTVYFNTKRKLITNPEQLEDFNKKVEKFLKRMDGRAHDHWGSDRYFRLLEKWFPDYGEVISGKVKSIKESIGLQVNSLNDRILEITAKTKEAMQLAGTDAGKARELLKQTNDKISEAQEKTKAAAATLTEFGTKEQQAQFAASYSKIISSYGALVNTIEGSIEGMGQDIARYQSLIPQLDAQAGKLKDFNSKVQKEQDVQALIQIQQTEFTLINKDIQSFIEGINLSRGTEAVNEEKVDQEIKQESDSLSELDGQVAEVKSKEIARREEEKRRKAEEERKRKEAEAERLRKEQEAAKLKPSDKKDEDIEITAENSASSNIALLISNWKTHGDGDKRKLAYILATVEGECGFRSKAEKKQVTAKTERQKELIRLQSRYWSSGYYGRGFVQITWKANYEKAKELTGVDVVTYPDKVLSPKVAATIAVKGMIDGMFTGKKLSHYFNDKKTDWVKARAIINGSDHADDFADKAKAHYDRLKSKDGGAAYYRDYLNFADKQTVLKAEGLYTGIIDGVRGPNSNKAIKAFKDKYDLKDENAFNKKIRELLHGKKEKAAPKEDKKKTPSAKEKVEALYAQYKKDEIDMVQLGKSLIPYASNDGATHVQAILEDLGRTNDNLAYAMVSNTDDSVLRLFNKDLLDDLADALAPENNYVNIDKKRILYNRITAITEPAKEEKTTEPEETTKVTKLSANKISASVGKGGTNKAKDVQLIQSFLVTFGYLSKSCSEIDTVKGLVPQNTVVKDEQLTETIKAIKEYQKYGATASYSKTEQKSVYQGDGLISKGGNTDASIQSMTKVHNSYSGEEPLEKEVTLLKDSQWVSQFRYGCNFYSGDTEKEYIDYVTELTGYEDANELHKASSEIIEKVKKKFEDKKHKWFDMTDSKNHALFTKDKAYEKKGNMVCCFDAANKMLGFTGATAEGAASKIQTFVEESGKGGEFTKQAALGIKYIDGQLRQGKAVFVAVDKVEEGKVQRNEGTSDHFIIIMGKAKDDDGWYYKYFEPGTSYMKRTGVSSDNKLYITNNKVKNSSYNLSQIRVNE